MKVHGGQRWRLLEADSRLALARLAENSIDALVTDPPYELTATGRTRPAPHVDNPYGRHRVGVNGDVRPVGGFMGKEWDGTGIAFDPSFWALVLRVLKPGAFGLSFGGSRTAHRIACAIEDAGFEIRDSVHWFYGTGFPKSLNLGEGRGTALKPGHEPIYLCRKPLDGTNAANLAKWGAGGLNIDACRIGTSKQVPGAPRGAITGNAFGTYGAQTGEESGHDPNVGRWPANVILDEGAAAELDAQSGISTSTGGSRGAGGQNGSLSPIGAQPEFKPGLGDRGGASRFFYVAKPTSTERDLGCDALPQKTGGEATDREDGSAGVQNPRAGAGRGGGRRNYHPTVKPITLMRYLVRLVTPVGGTVIDPFTGSGTTGIAARLEGRGFVGIEREAEYVTIAKARIAGAAP